MADRYVIDAMMGCRDGLFCFCPIRGDIAGEFTIVAGLNFIGAEPPPEAKIVAVVHKEGQAAVDAFCEEHAAALAALEQRLEARAAGGHEAAARGQPGDSCGFDEW